jgi:putative ABC transport system permease protein
MVANSVLTVSFGEGMRYIPFAVAGSIVLRVAKFPDFGFAGAFLLGACSLQMTQHIICYDSSVLSSALLWYALILSLLAGGLCGILTSSLFLYLRLNSLISGIITMLVAYSLSVGLSRTSTLEMSGSRLSTSFVGLTGIGLALLVVALFCSRPFLRFRMLCAKPNLNRQIDTSPNVAILVVMSIGNGLAGLSGYLCERSLGASSFGMADDKMFLALTSLILGESLLSLIITLAIRVASYNMASGTTLGEAVVGRLFFQYGANTPFLMLAAIIGPPLYWLTFSGSTTLLQISTDWNKLFLALSIVLVLTLSQLRPNWGASREEWTFQERRSW